MDNITVVAARVTPDVHERLRVAAFREKTNRATIIRKAVETYLDSHHPEQPKKGKS